MADFVFGRALIDAAQRKHVKYEAKVFKGDIYGDHVVSCADIIGIKHCHTVVRDTLVDICYRSRISAGLDMCVDLTGSSPLTQTGMADFVPGRTVIDVAQRKRVKYMAKRAAIGYEFLSFSFSSFGELKVDTLTLLKQIQKFSMVYNIGQTFYGTETMIMVNIFGAAVFILVLVLRPITEGQVVPVVPVTPFAPRPLCNFQMALANQACAYLPFMQVPPPAPRAPFTPPPPPSDEDTDHDEHRHEHHRRERDEDPDHGDHDDHDHYGDDHDDHDHDDQDHDHDHDNEHHRRKHHNHHRSRHHHHDTPVEQQCCKWLSQVDDQCVCDLLVRLPPFLARPVHKLSVIVGRACNITYSCGSRLRT
uniref:Uncharacterized protein n=1 Tax=Tanacetum cinerariifolium TaxID=118510 RepID=A0A6L2MM80_TANCI|nr:hypothetical protein [Tanacetum cinerariifolium]